MQTPLHLRGMIDQRASGLYIAVLGRNVRGTPLPNTLSNKQQQTSRHQITVVMATGNHGITRRGRLGRGSRVVSKPCRIRRDGPKTPYYVRILGSGFDTCRSQEATLGCRLAGQALHAKGAAVTETSDELLPQ